MSLPDPEKGYRTLFKSLEVLHLVSIKDQTFDKTLSSNKILQKLGTKYFVLPTK